MQHEGHEFTVATFNVHGWKDEANILNLNRVMETVGKYKPDIICLQEIKNGGQSNLKTFADVRGYDPNHDCDRVHYDFDRKHGIAILSKSPMNKMPNPSPSKTGFVMSEVALSPGFSIYVTGIHLDHKKEPKRKTEIQEIRDTLNDIIPEDSCQIWLGDFNALTLDDYTEDELKEVARVRAECKPKPWEPPKGELTQKITNEYEFVDTWREDGCRTPLKTCRYNTRIDYIFANRQLLEMFDVVEVIHDPDTASDHQMVVTKFVSKLSNR